MPVVLNTNWDKVRNVDIEVKMWSTMSLMIDRVPGIRPAVTWTKSLFPPASLGAEIFPPTLEGRVRHRNNVDLPLGSKLRLDELECYNQVKGPISEVINPWFVGTDIKDLLNVGVNRLPAEVIEKIKQEIEQIS